MSWKQALTVPVATAAFYGMYNDQYWKWIALVVLAVTSIVLNYNTVKVKIKTDRTEVTLETTRDKEG